LNIKIEPVVKLVTFPVLSFSKNSNVDVLVS